MASQPTTAPPPPGSARELVKAMQERTRDLVGQLVRSSSSVISRTCPLGRSLPS